MSINKVDKNEKQGIQSVEHAFLILDTIKNNSDSLTLSKISDLTEMSRSRVQKYLISFLKLGVLVQNKKDYTYSYGTKLLEIGLDSLHRFDIIEMSDPYLKEVCKEIGQTSALNIWTPTGPIVVKSEQSENPVSVSIKVGYRPPLYKSATGKCFAAFMSPNKVSEFINNEVKQHNYNRSRIEKELKEIKKNGYSYRDTYHEGVPGGVAITCPVFNNSGSIIAAISIIGFSESMNTTVESEEVKKLKEVSLNLSHEIFYYTWL